MKSLTELQQELPVLERELEETTRQVTSINQLGANLQTMTTAHALGNVTASDLLKAQRLHDDAVQAVQRKELLTKSVFEQKQMIAFAQAQEKRQFIDNIGKQFSEVRERYQVESQKLLGIFKEMHRLHNQSISMRSHQLMTEGDYRLDLPALRSPNDSELFSVGSMVRSGSL
jgi:hypothetical protein